MQLLNAGVVQKSKSLARILDTEVFRHFKHQTGYFVVSAQ